MANYSRSRSFFKCAWEGLLFPFVPVSSLLGDLAFLKMPSGLQLDHRSYPPDFPSGGMTWSVGRWSGWSRGGSIKPEEP